MQIPSRTLPTPPLDLIFPEYFQGDPPVEDVALENLTDEELLFKWTCKVKNLAPEQLLFKWNSHSNPDVAKSFDLESSKRQWDDIYSDFISVALQDCFDKIVQPELDLMDQQLTGEAQYLQGIAERVAQLEECCTLLAQGNRDENGISIAVGQLQLNNLEHAAVESALPAYTPLVNSSMVVENLSLLDHIANHLFQLIDWIKQCTVNICSLIFRQ
jgi:hypothetical protein